MRAISFRGKRIDNGEWVYGYLIGDDVIVGNIVEFNDEYFNTSFWYKVVPETVGQYTDLNDKNGKEIWEGDLYKSWNGLFVVGWLPFDAGLYLIEVSEWQAYMNDKESPCNVESLNKMRYDFFSQMGEGEIIGNIHQNKELISNGETS